MRVPSPGVAAAAAVQTVPVASRICRPLPCRLGSTVADVKVAFIPRPGAESTQIRRSGPRSAETSETRVIDAAGQSGRPNAGPGLRETGIIRVVEPMEKCRNRICGVVLEKAWAEPCSRF